MLKVENLCKSFDGVEVLKDISFEAREGEVLSIIGPSGSGKSTMLRCMVGLEKKDSGTIGLCRNGEKPKVGDEVRKGMVFQNFNLFPHMSVLKNITLAKTMVEGVSEKEANERAMKLLKMVGLEEKRDAKPNSLSGGQKQRIAIARALIKDPEILFFDEPTSALDPESIKGIVEMMELLKGYGMTVVVVSHDINFVKRISDKIVFLVDGEIADRGSRDEVFQRDENSRIGNFIKTFEY